MCRAVELVRDVVLTSVADRQDATALDEHDLLGWPSFWWSSASVILSIKPRELLTHPHAVGCRLPRDTLLVLPTVRARAAHSRDCGNLGAERCALPAVEQVRLARILDTGQQHYLNMHL